MHRLALIFLLVAEAAAQTTFGGNAQHTGNYSPAAQDLNAVHWTAPIDLNNTGAFAHYGAPILSPANTIFVPVKTGATGGFEINVFHAASGAAMYSLNTDYIQPSHNWILVYQPVLATSIFGTRLYYPGAGGSIYYIDNVDSTSHGPPVQQVFYTSLANYKANAAAFNSTVFINTPVTADSSGNVFFGFRVDGVAPAPLNTSQSGFARIDPSGNTTYVLAGTAAGDANIGRDTHNSAPALSNDQTTLYVAVKSLTSETYGYLLGLDSTTLATKFKVFLKDPRSSNANNATILDDSTASPMVGLDNDVYFGIFGNPANGSRGFMLHFSGDLTAEKTPGGFGWDNTTSAVPASMVPAYTGTSSYLLFSKYNNYANAGNDSGDGVNRVAVLDPNATQVDAHTSSKGMLIMREVLTVIGPTADKENRSASLPLAVREWCINTAAVNPATNSVFFPSEDGHIYRWNLASNSLTQFLQLNAGVGLPYVPTVIGPDGQVYTLNGGTLSAIGNLNGISVALNTSVPDVRGVVAGQPLTYSVAVTNSAMSGNTPSGTVKLQDTTYYVPSPNVVNSTTTALASNLPLDSHGNATYTTSGLTADKHFITASYIGDANFSAGSSSLIQFVHASGTNISLAASPNPSTVGQTVTLTATATASGPGSGTPTGMITFLDSTTVLGQVPLSSSGVASFSTSTLAAGSHTLTAIYASDTNFAAGNGGMLQIVQPASPATATTVSSLPNPSVFGQPVTFTSTTTSSGGVPTGTVTFSEGGTVLATNLAVNGQGHASFSTAALAAGSHTIIASFTGVNGWGNSSGKSAPQVVAKANTNATVTSSSNPSLYSEPITLAATVTATAPGSGMPTGTVAFKNGAATMGTSVLDGSGNATLTTLTLPVGTHSITVDYRGSPSFAASVSPVLTQTINKAGTTTGLTSSLNPARANQTVTFTATVVANAPGTGIPTGTVKFNDGARTLGSVSLSAGSASFTTSILSTGAHQITAVYQGSSGFLTSSSTVLAQTVN